MYVVYQKKYFKRSQLFSNNTSNRGLVTNKEDFDNILKIIKRAYIIITNLI